MWRNYLTVGIRALAKSRTYAAINILGLAIGMAACLMILNFVRYELNYDKDLPDADRAYQFQTYYTDPQTGEEGNLQMAAYVTKQALLKDFPQIERVVYAQAAGPVLLKDGSSYAIEDFHLVDGPLFQILKFPFVKGDPATALNEVGSLVLTESEAHKYFGDKNPIGQTMSMVTKGVTYDYKVTGVLKDLPRNSHFKMSMAARYDPQSMWADQPDFLTNWGWQSGRMYVQLRPGADPASVTSQLHAWEKRNIPDENYGGQRFNQGDIAEFGLVNVRDVHLGKAQNGAMTPGNDKRTIITFGIVALLILGMACVNFVNLSTARASQRAREVALRKVLGANRKQLIVQFIGETVLVAAVSMLLALAITEVATPILADFLKADFKVSYFGEGSMLLPAIVLVLVVGVLGGMYPAFYLSRFEPARVLKANKSSADAEGSGRLRNLLVVGQFAVSIGLIICTAVVYAQTVYARSADPGFKREGLMQIDGIGRKQLNPVIDTIVDEIGKVKGVTSVGRTTIGIATDNHQSSGVIVPGRKDYVNMSTYQVDTTFFKTMGIAFLAGRDFDINRPKDDTARPTPEDPAAERAFVERGANTVANELAIKRLGIKSPQEAIGKTFRTAIVDPEYGGAVDVTIVGVVRDARFRSIREPLEPIFYFYDSNYQTTMLVRYNDPSPGAVRERVEAVWRRHAPDVPFDAKFSDDIVRDLYQAESARASIFAGFAGLSIIVGCLGLFGLAAFTAERRTKEIGIRKVLGARTRDIVQLLIWQFSKPVLVANLIAWPVAWWVMRDWLNSFDTRIDLGPQWFVAAGLLAMVIAASTVFAHAVRVSRANPIGALRYE